MQCVHMKKQTAQHTVEGRMQNAFRHARLSPTGHCTACQLCSAVLFILLLTGRPISRGMLLLLLLLPAHIAPQMLQYANCVG